jgi:hypothetical protein
MNSPCPSLRRRRPFALVPTCVLIVASIASAQQAPVNDSVKAQQDAKALAKYDQNKNGKLDPDELNAMAADEAKNGTSAGEAIMLSPFEVTAENAGYMATNSASGTRLNSKLEDLASPISVVTKQQLQDMAAVDLNDIFRTETNVEGLYQYTEIGNDRNNIVDTASNNPEANNRIRGMGQANVTSGGMSVSSAIPIDSYNVDSVEINRGANSNIFGIGSTSGTVNLNLSTGNMTREVTKFSVMTDDLGRARGTFDINRPIIRNKLALRLIGAYDKLGFVREPSESITKRFTVALRAQPFRKTSVKLSYETYRNSSSLPNQLTPREQITAWKAAGGYTWNPATFTVHDAAGNAIPGATYLGTANGTAQNGQIQLMNAYRFRAGPGSFANGGDSNLQRPMLGFVDGRVAYFTGTHSWTTSANPTNGNYTYANNGNVRMADWEPTPVLVYVKENNPATGQPFGFLPSSLDVFQPGVSGAEGKAFYDWEKINLNAVNHATRSSNIVRFEVEQNIFTTKRQLLAVQFAGLYEDIENKSYNFIGGGGDGVQAVFYPDINRVLPNGAPNPGFLRPHLRARGPQVMYRPEENDTHKAQIAYQLDYSQDEGWSKWLGRHNVVGYGEQRNRRFSQNAVRYQTRIANTDGFERQIFNAETVNYRYYFGDTQGGNIDHSYTGAPTTGVFPLTYWSTDYGPTGTVRFDDPKWRTADATLAETMNSAGTNKNEFRTQGVIWQGFLLDGRIIPTIGYRKDRARFKVNKPFPGTYFIGSGGPYTEPTQGLFDFRDDYIVTNSRLGLAQNKGATRTKGVVLKPFQKIKRLGLLQGVSFTYNESDSFEPAGLAIDTYGEIVGDPRGKDKNYGVRFNLINERLWISVNKYKAETINARNGGADVVAQRAIPFDRDTNEGDPDNAFGGVGSGTQLDLFDWYFYRIYGETTLPQGSPAGTQPAPFRNNSGDPTYAAAKNLIGSTTAETLQRVTDHVWSLMQFDKEVVRRFTNTPGATRTATNDVTSQGHELEVLYRSRDGNLNLKLTGARKETIDSNLAESLTRYIAERQPILEKASYTPMSGPNAGVTESYWLTPSSGTPALRRDQWAGTVLSTYNPLVANLGKPRTQVRKYSVSATGSYNFRGMFANEILKNIRMGGNVGWVSKASIGYGYLTPVPNPQTGELRITTVDPTKRFYDKARYSASAWAAYDFRIFSGRVKSSVQLNVQNLLEGGRLQATHVRSDGTPWNFRIIDPRVYQLTLNFDL